MPDEATVLRKKLKVKSVGEPKPIGKGAKYPFKAVIVGKEEMKDYEFWTKSLVEFIKPDTEIDVDIEYSQTGEYKHRKVIQLYKDGQPIIKPKGSYGGGGSRRDEDRTDARTAIMSITELAKEEGRLERIEASKSDLALAFLAWCYVALSMKVTKKN